MEIKKDILQLADMYDTFFVDVYGVLFDGICLYENTLSTLELLKKAGKNVVIISNTTQVISDAKLGYQQRGIIEGVHYDYVVTSGGFLNYTLINDFQEFSKTLSVKSCKFRCIFRGNGGVFDGSQIKATDNQDEADFIYIGVPRASYGAVRIDDQMENGCILNIEEVTSRNWLSLKDSLGRHGLAEFAIQLEACLKKDKALLVANPDIFSHGSIDNSNKKFPIVTQGCLGSYYEKLGGRVVYFGKPYKAIFEYAKKFVPASSKIAMIGDTPWTDILGGNISGIDSILTLTGVSEEFFKKLGNSMTISEKVDVLLNKISPKMTNIKHDIKATHVIERFAHL